MTRKLLAFALALVLFCSGCAVADGEQPGRTTSGRATSEPVTADYAGAVVLAAKTPKTDDYKPCGGAVSQPLPADFTYGTASAVLSAADGNAAYSPVSLYFALVMLREGTTGKTRECLDSLLGDPSAELAKTQAEMLYTDRENGRLLIANSLWTSDAVSYQPDFLNSIEQNFYASLMKTTFGATANAQMSKWVSDNTGGLLTPTFETDENTVLELLNTLYMETAWNSKFDADRNTTGSFTTASGHPETVTFMNCTFANTTVWKTKLATRVELATTLGTMRYVLPDDGIALEALIADPAALKESLTGGEEQSVKLTLALPKADISTETDLVSTLSALGCETLFKPNNTDLSGIVNGDIPLQISRLRQGARIIWDENGVTGGAFTEVGVAMSTMPQVRAELTLRFERPFLYAATAKNGDILFTGTVTELG